VQTGFQMEGTREAAFASLIELDRTEVFVDAREPSDPGKPLTLRAGWGLRVNVPFWTHVVSHWSSLKQALGSDLVARLVDAPDRLWDAVSCLASPGDEAAMDCLDYLERGPTGAVLTINLLGFLERERRTTPLLRQRCLTAMSARSRQGGYDSLGVCAAVILGRSFSGDEETLSVIADGMPKDDGPPVVPLVAMCEGWARSDALDQVFRYLRENRVAMPHMAYYAVVATKSTTERVVEALTRLQDVLAGMRPWEISCAARFVLRRLSHDESAYEAALRAAEQAQDRVVAGTILRLIGAARGFSDETRALIDSLATRELSGTPTVIVDPITGRERPLVHCLLDSQTLSRGLGSGAAVVRPKSGWRPAAVQPTAPVRLKAVASHGDHNHRPLLGERKDARVRCASHAFVTHVRRVVPSRSHRLGE
jgi:hypothetical protein